MAPRKTMPSASALAGIFLLMPSALCHMEMSWPYPLHSKYDPANQADQNIDYSMTSPLASDGSDFPCKGYQNDRPIRTTAEYDAGESYNMTLAGTATHEGGSCQLSLSYDNAATFRVIKSWIGGCPLESTLDFTIPSYAPSGTALLAWTWQNKVGNREFYMNCAEVNITGSASSERRQRRRSRRRRDTFTSFEELPGIWKANLPGINKCTTTEGEIPVYPNPGPEVEYADGMDSSSPATSGECDDPKPYGQTYEKLEDSPEPPYPDFAPSPSEPSPGNGTGNSTEPPAENSTARNSYAPTPPNQRPRMSTVDGTALASGTPDRTTSGFVLVITDAASSVANSSTSAHRLSRRSTNIVMTTSSSTAAAALPSTPPSEQPVYAADDANRYLPCVPGTFICTSNTTWETCNYNAGTVPDQPPTAWVYGYPRKVAAGMQCQPNQTPYSSADKAYAQQALTPPGYHRDDKIVAARADVGRGGCAPEGAMRCSGGGGQFETCNHGVWVVRAVASGTRCVDGVIVMG